MTLKEPSHQRNHPFGTPILRTVRMGETTHRKGAQSRRRHARGTWRIISGLSQELES
jgi:hypothetical protein